MRKLLCVTIVSIFIISGCNRKSDEQAFAVPENKGKQTGSEARTQKILSSPLFSGKSLTRYLSNNDTLLYIAFPDIADFASVIANSSLKSFWTNPVLIEVLEKYLSSNTFDIIKRESVRLAKGMYRGPLEIGISIVTDKKNTLSPEFQILWRTGNQTENCINDLTDFLTGFAAQNTDLKISREKISNRTIRKLTFENKPAHSIYFADIDQSVRLSTDRSFFKMWSESSSNLKTKPTFKSALSRSDFNNKSILYIYADIDNCFELVRKNTEKNWKLFEATGLDNLDYVTFGVQRNKGKIRELVYIDWPRKDRDLISPLLCNANVQGTLSVVPKNVISFNLMGIDLLKLWKKTTGFAVRQFPQAEKIIQNVSSQSRLMLGKGLDEILDSFGHDIASYTIVNSKNIPVQVFLFSLKDAAVLQKIILKFDKQFSERSGKGLLLESVDKIEIFGIQKPVLPVPVYFAVCKQHFVISQDLDYVRDFVENRKGRLTPLTANSEIREILKREKAVGLSYSDVSRQLSYMTEFAENSFVNLPNASESDSIRKIIFSDNVKSLFANTGKNIGKVWSIISASPGGISFEISSDSGMLPFGLSAATAAAAITVPEIVKEKRKRNEKDVIAKIKNVLKSQYKFRLKYSRYAENLWELKRYQLIRDPALSRGYKNGYLFKLKSSGPNNWILEARPVDKTGRFFYCDQTGTLRAEEGEPARNVSPVVEQ